MKKICVCGHFADGIDSFDGQTIKTRNVYNELKNKYGEKNVYFIDTYNWKKKPLRLFFNCVKYSKKSSDIIILPAHKGVKVFIPLFVFFKKIFKFKLHYVVIGGWIYNLIKDNKRMKEKMKKVDFIYIENNKTIKHLSSLGLVNLYQMNNFKNLKISNYNIKSNSKEFNCCIFSRIEEKKGINEAIDVVSKINNELNNIVKLDIYGKVSSEYKDFFNKKISNNKNIKYCGAVDSNKSVEAIEKYDLLVFPTLYYTEGIPGTIIDAYFSGVPVLASKWENFDEIVDDNVTGFGYEFQNIDDFYSKLKYILKNRSILHEMKNNCKNKAYNYSPSNALKILFKNIGE